MRMICVVIALCLAVPAFAKPEKVAAKLPETKSETKKPEANINLRTETKMPNMAESLLDSPDIKELARKEKADEAIKCKQGRDHKGDETSSCTTTVWDSEKK